MEVKIILFFLTLLALNFSFQFAKSFLEMEQDTKTPWFVGIILGGITNFFDTLGIGSFAPTTVFIKYSKATTPERIPGTLNVANALPTYLQALFFITAVKVDLMTLISLIVASVIGSYIGALYISKLSRGTVLTIMGISLIIVAGVMFAKINGYIDLLGTGNETALSGVKLGIGILGFCILGALMSAGVGLYAPAMAFVYVLGLSPIVAFPIMMGSSAFLMTVSSLAFIKRERYAPTLSLYITLGGLVGVYIAARFVKSLKLEQLTLVIICVLLLTGIFMIYESYQGHRKRIGSPKTSVA